LTAGFEPPEVRQCGLLLAAPTGDLHRLLAVLATAVFYDCCFLRLLTLDSMVRFNDNTERQPRNYLMRREQWRLLLMVGLLGLVVLAMQRVKSPAGVETLEQVFGDTAPTAGADYEPANGAVNMAANPATESSSSPPTEEPAVRSTRQPAGPPPMLLPLDANRFEAVRDNSRFRNEETEAWFYVLGELQQLPGADLPPDETAITYAQLIRQPEVYRGRPVRVVGRVRRIETFRPAGNDLGIDQLYRLIIQLPGRQPWPLTIYSLDDPTAGDQRGEVDIPMRAAGYFFKNQSYRSQAGMGLTPIVLVKSIRVMPTETLSKVDEQPMDFSMVLVAAGAISALLVGFIVLRSRADSRRPSRSPARGGKVIEIDVPSHSLASPDISSQGLESDGHDD